MCSIRLCTAAVIVVSITVTTITVIIVTFITLVSHCWGPVTPPEEDLLVKRPWRHLAQAQILEEAPEVSRHHPG